MFADCKVLIKYRIRIRIRLLFYAVSATKAI